MAMKQEELDAFIATIATMPTEKQVKLFLKIREARAAATRAYEDQDAQFKAIMEAAQNRMLATADEQGTTGFKTDMGTTYVGESMKVSVADSTAFTAFLDALPNDGDRYGFFEQRISSRRIEDYIKANGVAPPGLNIFRERTMRVRKASEK